MFIAELDRPWLDTPFLLQGFLLDDQADLVEVQKYCEFVYVDPARSRPEAIANLVSISTPAVQEDLLKTGSIASGTIIYNAKQSNKDKKAPAAQTASRAESQTPGAAEPRVVIYEDAQAAKAKARAKTQSGQATERPRKWEVFADDGGEPSAIVMQRQGTPKKPGFLEGLISSLRKKGGRDEDGESSGVGQEGSSDAEIQLAYSKPLVRIERNRIIHDEELLVAKDIHSRSQEMIRGIVEDLKRDRQLDLDKASEVIGEMVESINRTPDALLWLTKLKSRDSYAYDHGIDVAIHLLAFGRHLGFPKETMHTLGLAGLMQDIGKLKLREELLSKPGKLTATEFQEMQHHVGFSVDILKGTKDIPVEVLQIVLQHHERADGSGYPAKLRSTQISTHGAMAGIVDSFEALTSERPYAPAQSTHQALQQLNRWKGKVFHDGLVEQFIQCIGIFPVGSLVELNTGDVAVVVAQNKIRRLKPKVMLVLDPEKKPYHFPILLELLNEPLSSEGVPFQIKRDLPVGAHDIDPQEFYL